MALGGSGGGAGLARSGSAGLASRLASDTGRSLGLLASGGLGGCLRCGGSSLGRQLLGHGDGVVL